MLNLTKEEIQKTREAILKELNQKIDNKKEKKTPHIFFDIKQSPNIKKKIKPRNFKKNTELKSTLKSTNKKTKQKIAYRLVKHLERKDSSLHHHHFLRGLKLLIFILSLMIIFMSGLLYVIFRFGAEGGT